MGKGGNSNLLRPEAGLVPFKKLQRRAQEALNRIIPALTESAKLAVAEASGGGQTLSEVDTNRASRLFFVSGEPGSGKSTVYLTLRAMTSTEEKFKEYGKGYKNHKELNKLKVAVRWLEPLDLEVTGDERDNLLAAVLVRLFYALDRSADILSKPCEAAIKELEELATDIGIAWEGNLRKRAGALDPATYSEEVMLAQRARLGVNHRLRQALDKLAKSGCCGCDNGTLFVLPVEDLYLKPDASLQLLRLLRMISVPRLFFLLLGDIKTVEALFTEKSLADWTDVAGTETFTAESPRLNEALARARELRARYLRKLLPPGQRAVIEVMDWDEALKFEPEQIAEKKDLKTLLKETPLDRLSGSLEIEDLLTFLVSPPLVESTPEVENEAQANRSTEEKERQERESRRKQDQRKGAQAAYTALQVLDATPREIMDLWFALNSPRSQNDPAPVLTLIEEFARYVVDEQSFLDEKEQNALLEIFPTRHYFDRELDLNRLRLDPESSRWIPHAREEPETSTRLWIRKHRSWKLAVEKDAIPMNSLGSTASRATDRTGQFNKLPPRPAAWIALLHDLSSNWGGSVTGSPVVKLCRRLDGQMQAWEPNSEPLTPPSDNLGWAVLDNGSTYEHFPMPRLTSFRELDRFLYIWNSGVEWYERYMNQTIEDEQNQIVRLINLWVLAGCLVDDHSYAEFAAREENWFYQQLAISETDRVRDGERGRWFEKISSLKTRALP